MTAKRSGAFADFGPDVRDMLADIERFTCGVCSAIRSPAGLAPQSLDGDPGGCRAPDLAVSGAGGLDGAGRCLGAGRCAGTRSQGRDQALATYQDGAKLPRAPGDQRRRTAMPENTTCLSRPSDGRPIRPCVLVAQAPVWMTAASSTGLYGYDVTAQAGRPDP